MPLMMLIIYGTIIAVMWIGGHQVFAGAMGSGELISFFTYVTEILISLLMVSMVMMMLTRSIACARRIIAVLEEKPEITDEAADPAVLAELRAAGAGSIILAPRPIAPPPTTKDW